MKNTPTTEEWEKKFYETWRDFWTEESQNTEQTYLTADTIGIIKDFVIKAISSTKQEERERINKILLEKMPDALHNYGAYILNNKETQPLERRAMKKSMTEAFIKVYFLTTLKER